MQNNKNTITAKGMFALLCDDSKYVPKSLKGKFEPIICGIYASKKEAQEVADEISDCPLTHTIKSCDIVCAITTKTKAKKGKTKSATKAK